MSSHIVRIIDRIRRTGQDFSCLGAADHHRSRPAVFRKELLRFFLQFQIDRYLKPAADLAVRENSASSENISRCVPRQIFSHSSFGKPLIIHLLQAALPFLLAVVTGIRSVTQQMNRRLTVRVPFLLPYRQSAVFCLDPRLISPAVFPLPHTVTVFIRAHQFTAQLFQQVCLAFR